MMMMITTIIIIVIIIISIYLYTMKLITAELMWQSVLLCNASYHGQPTNNNNNNNNNNDNNNDNNNNNNNKHLFIHNETNYSRADVVVCNERQSVLLCNASYHGHPTNFFTS